MDWLPLLGFIACPLMMLFCMKGMFGGSKDKKSASAQTQVSQQEMQQLQIKMGELMEQNHKQMKEIEALKANSSNNIDLPEGNMYKREIS